MAFFFEFFLGSIRRQASAAPRWSRGTHSSSGTSRWKIRIQNWNWVWVWVGSHCWVEDEGEARCADLYKWSKRRRTSQFTAGLDSSGSSPLISTVCSRLGLGPKRPQESRQAMPERSRSSRDSGHIEQGKMWNQGQVFLKYVLKFLFNAYIRQHTRALSNSPLGVVTTAWV